MLEYLATGATGHAASTCFEAIRSLPPAHAVVIDLDRPDEWRAERYWRLPLDDDAPPTFQVAAKHLRELFLESISLHLRSDRPVGVLLSGLCALHCLLGLLLVSALGIGSQLLLAPAIHQIGLALAIVVGGLTLGLGVLRHGAFGPLLLGTCGIALMAAALITGHGPYEAVLTIAGVGLLALAHIRNLRHSP